MAGGCASGRVYSYLYGSTSYSERKVLNTGSDPIYCVDLSGDGKTLIAGGGNTNLVIHKGTNAMFDNTAFQTLIDATDDIHACAISNDANIIVTGSRDRSVRVYYLSGGNYKLVQ